MTLHKQQGDNHDHLAISFFISLGILQQQGSGWSSKPSKNKETKCKPKNCVLWQLPPNNRLANRY